MTIKAFSREYLQNYISGKLIDGQVYNKKLKDNYDYSVDIEKQKRYLCRFLMEELLLFRYDCKIMCEKCRYIYVFTHPSQAPEQDLICECGYKVIEYDKDISNSKEYGCKKELTGKLPKRKPPLQKTTK